MADPVPLPTQGGWRCGKARFGIAAPAPSTMVCIARVASG